MLSKNSLKKFKSNKFLKISLLSLYLALTFPIPFITVNSLKIISTILLIIGLFIINNITNYSVETSDNYILYKTNNISNLLGYKSWQIDWKDIKEIKSRNTSQGRNVYYLITNKLNVLIPQRIENFEDLVSIIASKTKINNHKIKAIAPLWTYKLLTLLSCLMLTGEIYAFCF